MNQCTITQRYKRHQSSEAYSVIDFVDVIALCCNRLAMPSHPFRESVLKPGTVKTRHNPLYTCPLFVKC